MNRNKFERYLLAHDCSIHHHGGDHDMWWNGNKESLVAIPRHKEVKPSIIRIVCKQCGVPIPREK